MDTVRSLSNWCSKVVPLLVVLSSPPEAVATYQTVGSASYTATEVMRPLMLAGPMQRQVMGLTQSAPSVPSAGALAGAGSSCERTGTVSRPSSPTIRSKERSLGRFIMVLHAGRG